MTVKLPGLYTILAIAAGILIVGGAILYAQFASPSARAAASTPFDLAASLTACKKGDRCIAVDPTCGLCCHYAAINAQAEKIYRDIFEQSCSSFHGLHCSSCSDIDGYPACVDGHCQLVPLGNGK